MLTYIGPVLSLKRQQSRSLCRCQDVSYGSKILVQDSGDRIEMSNVVRTVTRSTMIEQYLECYKLQCHKPLSRFALFKMLEIREASQRK